MATVINNPGTTSDSSGVNGVLIAVVLVGLVLLFWFVGMPYFRGSMNRVETPSINVENKVQAPEGAPAQGGDTTINIPVPEKVDINVKNDQGGQ